MSGTGKEDEEMKIIHQTAEYVVVCKAAGEDSEHDLPGLLAEQNGDQATDYYVVHRLDKAAAGLLVLARDRQTAGELSRQLTENRLRKSYLCVVPGVPEPASGEMQDLLYKDKMKHIPGAGDAGIGFERCVESGEAGRRSSRESGAGAVGSAESRTGGS
mgnify:CR=1 FL=1